MYVIIFKGNIVRCIFNDIQTAQQVASEIGAKMYRLTEIETTTRQTELDVPILRDLIYRLVDTHSPVAEGEIEEIARCALRGEYKLDIPALDKAQATFERGEDDN